MVVAGGQGAHPVLGKRLESFIPESQVYLVAKAIKNIFNRYGNRKNTRTRGKLKFLWEKLGEDKFVNLYRSEKEKLLKNKKHIKDFETLLDDFKQQTKAHFAATSSGNLCRRRKSSFKPPGAAKDNGGEWHGK